MKVYRVVIDSLFGRTVRWHANKRLAQREVSDALDKGVKPIFTVLDLPGGKRSLVEWLNKHAG